MSLARGRNERVLIREHTFFCPVFNFLYLQQIQPTTRILRSRCIHPKVETVWRYSDSDYIATGPNIWSDFSFQNCYEDCRRLVSSHMRIEDEVKHESFYGLSYLYLRAVAGGIIPEHTAEAEVAVEEYYHAAERICSSPDQENSPFLCLDLSYISAMLIEGLGLRREQKMRVVTTIDGIEVSWSLGAVFHTLNSFHNTPHVKWDKKVRS